MKKFFYPFLAKIYFIPLLLTMGLIAYYDDIDITILILIGVVFISIFSRALNFGVENNNLIIRYFIFPIKRIESIREVKFINELSRNVSFQNLKYYLDYPYYQITTADGLKFKIASFRSTKSIFTESRFISALVKLKENGVVVESAIPESIQKGFIGVRLDNNKPVSSAVWGVVLVVVLISISIILYYWWYLVS